ncbi:hypothetical protein PDG61_25105 [Mycolicibacterium sp. BiH015]|uniref:hypothetical protein n=1 Tax=Mycolicibacterium sp. BiH015 TaxID=3018808 RepID=UPI0022E92E90|nr:hypothetical protein [Mycolicibacterium sp. BiH015]MDA2894211.1 hypothetical protein [Mycolicibacterium sp. BiH015]
MREKHSRWLKVKEWVRRYLPCEIAGTTAEFGAAALTYVTTGSLALAAVAATVGASIGYYAAAYVSALRWSYRDQAHRQGARRVAVANLLALRSVAVEFGPAELVDSVAVRPLAFYVGPMMFGNVLVGWIFGKLVSDVAFYACAIFSYERFTALLARNRPHSEIGEEGGHEPTVAVSAA